MSLYNKLNYLSILAILLLFFLGGLVRSTGSGMGCPDWPKCYDSYLPPTSADQLPQDYKERYLEERKTKTQRFVSLLEAIRLKAMAQRISASESLEELHEFSVAKAYTEYINRIWGALTGLIVLGAFLSAFRIRKKHKAILLWTFLGFAGVLVNGLLGAVVVNANLFPGLVSIHFLAAFASVSFFMLARRRSKNWPVLKTDSRARWTAFLLFGFLLIQIVIGTRVRESYEAMLPQMGELRVDNIHLLGRSFVFHRLIALLTTIIGLAQFLRWRSAKIDDKILNYSKLILALLILQVIAGSMIAGTGLEAISTLFHIVFAAALFTAQLYICTRISGPSPIESN